MNSGAMLAFQKLDQMGLECVTRFLKRDHRHARARAGSKIQSELHRSIPLRSYRDRIQDVAFSGFRLSTRQQIRPYKHERKPADTLLLAFDPFEESIDWNVAIQTGDTRPRCRLRSEMSLELPGLR